MATSEAVIPPDLRDKIRSLLAEDPKLDESIAADKLRGLTDQLN